MAKTSRNGVRRRAHTDWLARVVGAIFIIALCMGWFEPAAAQTTTGNSTTGQTLYTSNGCGGCHTSATSPYPAFQNAANAGGVIGNATAAGMGGFSAASFTATQENNLAAYVATLVSALATQPVSFNTAKSIALDDVRVGSTYSNFANITIVANGARGSAAWTSSNNVTYTPTSGQCGSDSFTYKAATGSFTTNVRTANVSIANPTVPAVTSATTKSGTVGTALSYSITTSGGTPTSYAITVGTLPAGVTINTSTGVISGTPTAAGTFNVTVAAFNCFNGTLAGQSGTRAVAFTIAKSAQTITFGAQTTPRTFAPGGTFAISPTGTASSGLAVTYTSNNTAVCTVSGTTVTMVAGGTCPIAADQAGNANFNAAAQVVQNVTISPAAQTITFGAQTTPRNYALNGTFPISPLATASSGLAVAYTSTTTGVCTVAGTTVTMVSAGTCTIAANQSGSASYNAAAQVTQSVTISATVPGAPTIGTASAGDAQLTVAFTAPANNGGTAITSYTATCSPSGSGSGATSPITVSGLANGTPYNCTVAAKNAVGFGAASAASNTVTPSPTPVAPVITSANATTFTVNSLGTFTATATGTPAPTVTLTGALPTGVTFASGTSSGTLSGTPALGTVGTYSVTIGANGSGSVTQPFTLTVAKASQSISFNPIANQPFSAATVPLTATSTSGQTVTFTSTTLPVCTVSGTNVTLVALGTCTIAANSAANANYNAATQTTQSFTVTQGSQTITFGAQSSHTYSPGGSFPINPVATASSGLAVSYAGTTPAVCTVSGTTVTMVGAGVCSIDASQGGNANYAAAAPVTQTVAINAAGQTITFAATQAAQGYSPGGTFALNPLGTASSGLAVNYASLTSGVCTLNVTTVTIIAAGACTIQASQPGDSNFNAAAPVSRSITINAVAPDAPTIGVPAAGNTQATIDFTAPVNNGGSAITMFTATCNPGAIAGTGAAAPITVTGLTNNTQYSCSVTANNVAGTSVPSSAVLVTPVSPNGPGLYSSICTQCHGAGPPSGPRFNAAGSTGTVLNYVRSTQPLMMANASVQALSGADLDAIASYIATQVPAIAPTTAVNTPKNIDVSSQITLNTVSFTTVESVLQPANGVLSLFNGTLVTYTPNPGFIGADTFSYRGTHTTPSLLQGDPRTITVNVVPVTYLLTVSSSGAGFGTITGTNINCGAACTDDVAAGGTVILTATPFGGYAFNAWTGCDSVAGNQCMVTLNSARNVSADFIGPPDAPNIVSAIPGDGLVTVNFTPPASDGGSPVQWYTVNCDPGAMWGTGAASPVAVSGLTDGVTYTCSVTASNAIGAGPPSATLDVTPTAIPAANLTGVVSRKTHGAAGDFDIVIDTAQIISGPVTTESRAIGAGFNIVFQFDAPIVSFGAATAVDKLGAPIGNVSPAINGNDVEVTLTAMPENTRVTVTLSDMNGFGIPVSASIGFLVGDVNNNRAVNSSDISGVKARSGQATDATNFRFDLNASGAVNSSDISAVKARSGLSLP